MGLMKRQLRSSTVIDGNHSECKKVTYRTAQGSILGPLILIIYVNDFFTQISDRNNILMYADDTLLMSSACTLHDSVVKCQAMLDNIMSWCGKNKLTVNIKKTKCMYINSCDNQMNAKLYINNTELDSVKNFEYLGMYMDDKCSMVKLVETMMKKARCKFGILCQIRRFISCDTSLLI